MASHLLQLTRAAVPTGHHDSGKLATGGRHSGHVYAATIQERTVCFVAQVSDDLQLAAVGPGTMLEARREQQHPTARQTAQVINYMPGPVGRSARMSVPELAADLTHRIDAFKGGDPNAVLDGLALTNAAELWR